MKSLPRLSPTRRAALAGVASLFARPVRAAQRVRMGFIPVLGSAQAFVIEGEGWAKDAGLDLQLIRFDSGPAAIQALASGQLDAYLAGVGPIVVARGQGVDVKVVAAAAIEELAVLARGPFAQLASAQGLKAGVAAFTTAQGRRPKLATQPPGSVPDTFLRYWLDRVNGVAFNEVDILGIGIDATQQGFLSGAVDAAVVREPALTLLRDRDRAAVLLATGGQMFPNQPGSVLAIYQPGLPERRAMVDTLVRLHLRATEMLAKDPARAAPHVHKVLSGGIVPLDVIARALVSPASHFIADPSVILQPTAAMQDYQLQLGVLRHASPVADAFDLETYRRIAA